MLSPPTMSCTLHIEPISTSMCSAKRRAVASDEAASRIGYFPLQKICLTKKVGRQLGDDLRAFSVGHVFIPFQNRERG
jgi:hypothetical protein